MKKLFIFAIVALGMLACSEKNAPENGGNDNGGNSNSQEISCDPNVLEFDFEKQSSQTITIESKGQWSATTNVNWLKIEPMSGEGDAFVKITCYTGDPAEGKIIFSTNHASAKVIVHRVDNNPDGFWVSETKQIRFSKGNLQYQPSTNTWRFADHQYDFIETSTNAAHIGNASYSGWLDLFTWASSGYSASRAPYQKFNIDRDDLGFYSTTDIAGTKYDWGVYNAISNGGNKAGQWRTLTNDEYGYLLNKRPNAAKLAGLGMVNGIKGVIFLPHGWVTPSGLSFVPKNIHSGAASYSDNKYSASEWNRMEEQGAIFHVIDGGTYCFKGYADATVYWTISESGTRYYWTSSIYHNAKCAYVYYGAMHHNNYCAVRLVQDVE